MGRTERDSASQRLEDAVDEQARLRGLFVSAIGTSNELSAFSRLRAAGQEAAW